MTYDQQYPITPPPELVKQWMTEFNGSLTWPGELALHLVAHAAQWGADQELEACLCEVSFLNSSALADRVRSKRRPKPPSLKEQALKAAHIEVDPQGKNGSLIIRALEALPDD